MSSTKCVIGHELLVPWSLYNYPHVSSGMPSRVNNSQDLLKVSSDAGIPTLARSTVSRFSRVCDCAFQTVVRECCYNAGWSARTDKIPLRIMRVRLERELLLLLSGAPPAFQSVIHSPVTLLGTPVQLHVHAGEELNVHIKHPNGWE